GSVSDRRIEIGIRMALGAEPAASVRLMMVRVSVPVSVGLVIGGIASLLATRFVATILYGLQPRDPTTLAVALVLLCTTSVLAAWAPARRAARIQPAQVLREG